jgi:general secretion pathway protein B
MSFILDALKKSENERQLQAGPSFVDIKSAPRASRPPTLWIAIGVLLTINVIILGIFLGRRGNLSSEPIPTAAAPTTPVATSMPATATAQASSLPATAAPLPPAAAPAAPVTDQDVAAQVAPEPRLDRPQLDNYATDQNLPTINDVVAQGRATLPDLHLDMHVFATSPAERFVSINSHKLREGMQLEEGLRVERITRDGVVLNYRGLRFLLPRQ